MPIIRFIDQPSQTFCNSDTYCALISYIHEYIHRVDKKILIYKFEECSRIFNYHYVYQICWMNQYISATYTRMSISTDHYCAHLNLVSRWWFDALQPCSLIT